MRSKEIEDMKREPKINYYYCDNKKNKNDLSERTIHRGKKIQHE
jgi:hypothetical protein